MSTDDPIDEITWTQRRVGIAFGCTSFVVATLLYSALVHSGDYDPIQTLLHPSVSPLLALSALFTWTGLSGRKIARFVQAAAFLAIAVGAAQGGEPGDITSAVFLGVGVALLSIYEPNGKRFRIVSGIETLIYVLALAIGFSTHEPPRGSYLGLAAQATLVLGLVVLTWVFVLAREKKYHARAQDLEQAVEKGTSDLRKALGERDSYVAELESTVRERDTLLRELHHRSKNNLQLVKSLVEMAESASADPSVQLPLRKSSDRINAIALVNEQLFRSERYGEVDLGAYLNDLLYALAPTIQGVLESDIEAVNGTIVDLDFAVPFGLIVTELVSNASEHARPAGDELLRVTVSLSLRDAEIVCVIQDNGSPPDPSPTCSKGNTSGLAIARGLADQIDGSLRITAGPSAGIRCEIQATAVLTDVLSQHRSNS